MNQTRHTPAEAVQYWYDAATERREERDKLRSVVARVRQMADAWEQRLPETIRTATAVDAIRTALEPAAASAVVAPPTDRAAWLEQAASIAEDVAESLRKHHEFERSNGALDVMTELRRLAGEAQQPDTAVRPARGDQFEAWLKAQRDAATGYTDAWNALDDVLDQYRLHADTGTPLGEHVCEGKVVGGLRVPGARPRGAARPPVP